MPIALAFWRFQLLKSAQILSTGNALQKKHTKKVKASWWYWNIRFFSFLLQKGRPMSTVILSSYRRRGKQAHVHPDNDTHIHQGVEEHHLTADDDWTNERTSEYANNNNNNIHQQQLIQSPKRIENSQLANDSRKGSKVCMANVQSKQSQHV